LCAADAPFFDNVMTRSCLGRAAPSIAGTALRPGLRSALRLVVLVSAIWSGAAAAQEQAQQSAMATVVAGDPIQPVVRAQPPEGFIDLLEPQTNYVDVYYGGRKIASTLATFTPDHVQFDDPFALMSGLADVTAPEEVLAALSGPLDTNGALVCLPGENDGCGVLEPAVAGIIFDRNRFRVDIFVAPDKRMVSTIDMGRHLEASDTGPGLVSSLRAIASGGTTEENSYNLRSDSILAYMDNRVDTALIYENEDGLLLDRATFEADRGDWRATAGLFRTAGMDMAGQEKILGLGLGTQLDTRVDLDLAYATPIVIFLPNRSKVDIFRDGRLVATKIYEAGNQTLDTSGLPNGSYDISLRIQELGGETREETRFFSKNPELPPAGSPIHVVQLGALVNDDKTGSGQQPLVGKIESTPILRAGTLHRLGENWGVFADTMASNEQLLAEVGGVLRDRPTRLRASVLATTDLDYGASIGYWDRIDAFGFNLSLRQIFAGRVEQQVSDDRFDPFNGSSTEFGAGLSYSVPDTPITLGLSGNYNKRGGDATWSVGPTASALIWQTGSYDFRFNASATQSNDDFLALGQLVVSFREGNWSALAATGYRLDTGGDGGPEGSGNVAWLKNWEDGRQFQFNAGVFSSPLQNSLTGGASYADPLAVVAVNVDRSLDDHDTSYSGEIELDLIGNMNGIAVTGFGGSDSAVIVKVEGDIPDEAAFEVYVNGSLRALVQRGMSLPIALDPYRSYDISLLTRSDDLFDFELGAQRVTLFPGNVATLTWHVLRILPVFGRAVYEDGEPVALARIEGAHDNASSDLNGYFQAQINGTRQLDFFVQGEAPCHVPIGELPQEAVFQDLGTVVCVR